MRHIKQMMTGLAEYIKEEEVKGNKVIHALHIFLKKKKELCKKK